LAVVSLGAQKGWISAEITGQLQWLLIRGALSKLDMIDMIDMIFNSI